MKRITSSLLLFLSLSLSTTAIAAVEDRSSFQASITTIGYCGITDVEPLSFIGDEINMDVNAVPRQEFDIEIVCPEGDYEFQFDGGAFGYEVAGGAAYVKISQDGGAIPSHASHVNGLEDVGSFTVVSGKGGFPVRKTFYATLHDSTDLNSSPKADMRWSGSVPVTLIRKY